MKDLTQHKCKHCGRLIRWGRRYEDGARVDKASDLMPCWDCAAAVREARKRGIQLKLEEA